MFHNNIVKLSEFITFLPMNYLFFSVKENPVIAHQWIISFLQMDCFHALISNCFHALISDVILWRNLFEGLCDLSLSMLESCSIYKEKIFINMIIIRGLYLFFFFSQFKAGHLSISYEIPTRHKRKLQHPTKTHIVCGVGVGVGVRNVINSLFVCFER